MDVKSITNKILEGADVRKSILEGVDVDEMSELLADYLNSCVADYYEEALAKNDSDIDPEVFVYVDSVKKLSEDVYEVKIGVEKSFYDSEEGGEISDNFTYKLLYNIKTNDIKELK